MKVTITNHDATGSVKIEAYDPNGNMNQPLDAQLLMPNQGLEGKEIQLLPGRCYLLTAVVDATLSDNGKIINPDSQQNMTVRERVNVAPVEQNSAPVDTKVDQPTPGPVDDPTIVHLPDVPTKTLDDGSVVSTESAATTTDKVAEAVAAAKAAQEGKSN